MNTAINTTFLSDEDLSQVQSILDEHGLSGFDASIRLWGRGKAIEVKGTLGRQELSCLLAIARFLGEGDPAAASGDDSAELPSPAGTVMGIPLTADTCAAHQAAA